jgi:protein tyrosine phosphatase (PTP) superfamily phosphohydrolase (DUF442 family)
MNQRLLPVFLLLLSAPACTSSQAPNETDGPVGTESASWSGQALQVEDAYALAAEIVLPAVPPQDFPELHNVYTLSENIISGSEPLGEKAFKELEAMGVKTIISVDGKTPNLALAAKHGMRYVHSPIRYKGIEPDEIQRLSKSFRELEAPFYVHCFHGKHRGPAAAAVGRVVLDGVGRERALAEMRQWCGTSKSYKGLYGTIASLPFPTAAESAEYEWDFPEARPMAGFRQAMVEIPRLSDNIELMADNDWNPDPMHPDLDALNEAVNLLSIFRQANELDEVAERPAAFRKLMEKSIEDNGLLVEALRTGDEAGALAAFDSIQASCKSCHKTYRNDR